MPLMTSLRISDKTIFFSAVVFLAMFVVSAAGADPDSPDLEHPRGRLFIIGGGDRPAAMMKRFTELASSFQTGKIVVLTMATSVPEETGPGLVEEFKALGAPNRPWRLRPSAFSAAREECFSRAATNRATPPFSWIRPSTAP